ncbi:glycosyltransferase family 4 protein [Vibrio vulnificus]|nr:glycosyltransferase family 4 protein [Vibrio vulnificus]HAS8115765.1 glycosyltransferase [Vibrio vulnificus]
MIAHFVYNFFSYSGAAFQAHSLCKNLDNKKQIIFNIGGAKRLDIKYIESILVVDLPNGYIRRLIYLSYFFFLYKIKIVHLHGWILTGLLPAVIFKKKIVLKTTMYNVDDLPSLANSKFNAFLIKYVSSVVSISSAIKLENDRYIAFNRLVCSSRYIPNGVGEMTSYNDCSLEPNFCTVGVVSKRKGTLKAINYFIENYIHLKDSMLYVVGPNPDDSKYAELDIDYYNKCLEMASAFPHKIKITGKLSKDELNEIYSKCVSHIFFSEREGMPNVLLESMSFNCVPIVTEIEGVSYDIIDNGVDGFILKTPELEKVSFFELCEIKKVSLPKMKIQEKFSLNRLSKLHEENYRALK